MRNKCDSFLIEDIHINPKSELYIIVMPLLPWTYQKL